MCRALVQAPSMIKKFRGVRSRKEAQCAEQPPANQTPVNTTSCRCGQGPNRKKDSFTSCDDYAKRCNCFKELKQCSIQCGCLNCNNPRRKETSEPPLVRVVVPRKRQKTKIQETLSMGIIETTTKPVSSEVEGKIIVMSVINFFMWNGIPLDERLIASVTAKTLETTENSSLKPEQLERLVTSGMGSLDANASLMGAKLYSL